MSMDVGGAKGGVKADINVTPLVDVMLVLLIIVILIAPMLQKGVDVSCLRPINTTDKPDTSDQTVVHVDSAQQALRERQAVATQAEAVARLQDSHGDGRGQDGLPQGRPRGALRRHHEHDGRAAEGRHRDRRPHHGEARRIKAEGGQ